MEAQRLPQETVLQVIENVQELAWERIGKVVTLTVKHLVEALLEEELTSQVRAGPYERTPSRRGRRGGHYRRRLTTRYGTVEDLKIPRPAEGGTEFSVLNRYERRRWDVDAALGRLFLEGVSTRRLKGIARELFGQEVSATTVSKTTAYLDEELERYQTHPLTDDVQFLFLDGIVQKVREIGMVRKVTLCAYGIRQDGGRELLSFRLAESEDLASWTGFLVDLKSRGLLGKALKLITVDGNPALLKALREVYPFVTVQRCIAHKLRNVSVKLKRVHQKACMTEAKGVFAAQSRGEALKRFKAWKARWQIEEERAVRCLERDLHHCLHYYRFPKEVWKQIRTTNVLERAFREVRRRTRPMGVLPNEASANRIFYGISKGMHRTGLHPVQSQQDS